MGKVTHLTLTTPYTYGDQPLKAATYSYDADIDRNPGFPDVSLSMATNMTRRAWLQRECRR